MKSHRYRVSIWNRLPLAGALSLACGADGTAPRPDEVPTFPEPAREATTSSEATEGPGSDGRQMPRADPGAPPSPGDEADGGRFVLAWQDDFDAFDASRWQLMTHSWDSNLAQFSATNARFEGGIASLRLSAAEADSVKPYRGVEMRSRSTLTYGKVEARARFAGGSGVVSSLVLIYTPWPADDWNELDVEFLGRYSDRIQFNAMVYTGAPTTAPVTTSVAPTQYPQIVPRDFDPAADFHVYAVEWTPSQIRFRVDGAVVHRWSERIELMRLPQNVLLTIWASSAAAWAGPIEADSVPAAAQYDWLRVYDWVER